MKPSVVLIALLLGTVMASVHPDPLDGILGDSKPALKAYIFNLNSELNKTKRELQIAQKQNLLLNDALVASNTRAEIGKAYVH